MSRRYTSALVGGGAAGTAMLIAASKAGILPAIARDLCVIERGPVLGAGRLGRYAITSDSTAATFLSAVRDNPVPALAALIDHPAALAIAGWGPEAAVPLPVVGRFLDVIGGVLADEVRAAGGTVLTGVEAAAARQTGAGWAICLRDGSAPIQAERLVLATGAAQPLDRLAAASVAGEPLVARAAGRLIQSDELLLEGGLEMALDRLAGRSPVRVAVVGGSTSALAAANRLLGHPHAPPFGRGGLTILHRRPLLAFYSSADAAHADGHHGFGPDDICQLSGFVHRFAGLRLDARALVRRQLGRTGEPDPRLRLHRIAPGRDEEALAVLDEADLVVAALGYRPLALRIEDIRGRAVPLAAEAGAPLVDEACRVIGDDGVPIPDLWGIGLAAGFRPTGPLGGEASFTGQVNGLWLWQNGVGAIIAEQLALPFVSERAA